MASYSKFQVEGGRPGSAVEAMVRGLLEAGAVGSVLVPARQPHAKVVMQTLVRDPAAARGLDPFAPVVPWSSATLAGRLTRSGNAGKVAAFLRPCEVRALVELVKLKQASLDDVLLVGVDCYGRFENREYAERLSGEEGSTRSFLEAMARGEEPEDLVGACKSCVTPVAEGVDLRLAVIGAAGGESLWLEAVTEAGRLSLSALGGEASDGPPGRAEAVESLVAARTKARLAARDAMRERVEDVSGLMDVIGGCVNCYNCRGACPVCYCRECVFATDVMTHEGRDYVRWADKRGHLRMPSDTLFYHLTRMAHMSTLCVGCGQCETACPNDVPLAALFGVVAERAQALFEYSPGLDPSAPQPLAHFEENELHGVTGQVK